MYITKSCLIPREIALTCDFCLQLDRIFQNMRVLRFLPASMHSWFQYFPTLMYSWFFILLGTSYPNALGFSHHFLLALNPEEPNQYALNQHFTKLVAVVVLSVITGVIYRSRWLGLQLNWGFALYKVCLVFGFFIAGVSQIRKYHHEDEKPITPGLQPLTGFFLVLFSYQGWESANYVRIQHQCFRYQMIPNWTPGFGRGCCFQEASHNWRNSCNFSRYSAVHISQFGNGMSNPNSFVHNDAN